MKFNAYGHENLLATHRNTFEFTNENFLTKRGDCIIGIDAKINFKDDVAKLKKTLDYNNSETIRKIKILITQGKHEELVTAFFNPDFDHHEAMVIRKSTFLDKRTFGYKANKSAKELKRDLFRELKTNDRDKKLSVQIKPVKIKNIIFDFDDTLEEWTQSQIKTNEVLAAKIKRDYGIKKSDFKREFRNAIEKFILHTKDPKKYGRDVWLNETFSKLGVKVPKSYIDELLDLYWTEIQKHIKLEKHVIPMLQKLKQKYNLYILSDSDGNREIKMVRIHQLNLESYFNDIITSDDTMSNKPTKQAFQFLLDKHKLNAEECFAVGDHAQTDLYTPKKLGMSTVWVKQGHWGKASDVDLNYVDFQITDLIDLVKIVEKFE